MKSYRCVVCQEEITAKEHSFSTKFYNMALCRKHQDIQKQIREKEKSEQKTTAKELEIETQNYCCVVCQEEITPKEYSYSTNLFNMALCRKHQDIQKQIKAKAEIEQKSAVSSVSKTISNIEDKKPEPQVQKESIPVKTEDALIQWITQWVSDKPINLSKESKQFFVSGMELEDFARDSIGKAQDEILITSPFVDSCHIVTALQRAVERRVKVKVVAQRPPNTKKDAKKADCQANLRKAGVVMHYINEIHAKIIVIDRKIAIVSSMNLYGGSIGGATFEAGIVSFDKTVVGSSAKYIGELLEKPESSDTANSGSTNYWKNRRY